MIEEPDMSHTSRPERLARRESQSGLAMMSALLVITVLSLVAIMAVQVSFHNQASVNTVQKRAQAIAGAEAGLDATYQELATVNGKCEIAATLNTSPTTTKYTATVKYYSAYPGDTSTLLACDPVTKALPVGTLPKAALISVTGSTNATKVYGDRQLQSLVKLNPVTSSSGFNKAIFANGNLSFNNNAQILGNNGPNADVYTNNAFTCANSLTIDGSVYTQLNAAFNNTCGVAGDVYAKNDVTIAGNSTIGGHVTSSKGLIRIDNPQARVKKNATAKGTITTASAANIEGARISGSTTIPDPPYVPFPVVNIDTPAQAQWNSAGFAFVENNNCNANQATSVFKLIENHATATGPKVIKTSCLLNWSNNTVLTMAQDLAIFSTGGFSPNNRFIVQSSATGVKRKLYWIIPHNTVSSMPCYSPTMMTTNQTQFVDVDTFMYSPCAVSMNNNTSSSGQIYAGSDVTTANLFTLKFVPLPVWGATSGEPSAPTGYKLDVAFKREVRKTS
jgi:hypothetical protein